MRKRDEAPFVQTSLFSAKAGPKLKVRENGGSWCGFSAAKRNEFRFPGLIKTSFLGAASQGKNGVFAIFRLAGRAPRRKSRVFRTGKAELIAQEWRNIMANYEKLASFIIENVGGKENIENVTHCMTRLRFKLTDDSKVNEEELKADKGVVTAQNSGGRYQVVIGTHVGDVCEEIMRLIGKAGAETEAAEETKGSLLNRFTATITQTMVPVLGVLGACGLIAGLQAILMTAGLIKPGDGAQILLNAMGNACLTFFPILLGYTSAKAFKMNPFVGMILGCVLAFPNITESINAGEAVYTLFAGTSLAMPVYKTLFGIPIFFPTTGYTSTVIPIIFATYFASKVEKRFDKIIPQAAQMYFLPMVTILLASIATLLIIGPVSVILTNLISTTITFLVKYSPIVAFVVIAMIYQPLVVLGLHWALISVGLIEFATSGNTLIISLIYPASFAHLAVCAAVYFKTKNKALKETALPAVISACFCIIEPSIYGVTLPVKKRFGICMLAGTIGAVILGIAKAPMYAITMGVTGFVGFVDPATGNSGGMYISLIAVAVTVATAFLLTWLTYQPKDDGDAASQTGPENPDKNKGKDRKETVFSPMSGSVKPLSAMQDPAFSQETLGKGICIEPVEGKVVAPCDGRLNVVFPTGHALGITSEDGTEVLIHVGVNTAQLPQGTFQIKKQQGEQVKKGDVLLTFDLDKIKEAGYNLETAVLISNTVDYLDVVEVAKEKVSYLDDLLVAIAAGKRTASA